MSLTAQSTVGEWLDHPTGGAAIRELLEAGGMDASVLTPARGLPLQQLVALSGGKLPQSVVDELVASMDSTGEATASGEQPAPAAGWQEKITPERFAGKTIIITGAASGIGRATASRIAREGGRVIATDISADGLDKLVADFPDADITAVAGDITQEDSIAAIMAAAGEQIDGLGNIAGINDDFSPLHETSDAMWERVMAVNLTGPFKLTRAVLPVMMAHGGGAVLNVASEAALRGSASGNAYTVSKHALVGLTVSAAFMYGPHGIRVNAVAPGGVATGIAMAPQMSEAGSARLRPFQQSIPTLATAEQLAASISFLLSDDGVNLNGVVLPSDGGWSVQ